MINYVSHVNALEIEMELLEAVHEAVARGEDGLTYKQAAALLEMSYEQTYGAVNALSRMGKIKIGSRADRNVCRIVLPGWEPPAKLDLTRKQRAALDYLISRMEGGPLLRASFRDIVKGAVLAKGGVVATLEALDKKGYIVILDRGRGTTPTLFHVYPEGDGPRSYSPMKPPMRSEPHHFPAPRFEEACASLMKENTDV